MLQLALKPLVCHKGHHVLIIIQNQEMDPSHTLYFEEKKI